MFDINERTIFKFFRLKDRYFASKADKTIKDCDAIYYFYCDSPEKNAHPFTTLFIDIQHSDEEILNSFKKNYRQVLRKVIRENLFTYEFIEDPSEVDILDYVENFNRFARIKGIYFCDENLLRNLQKASKLRINKVFFEGEVVCSFAYIQDGNRVTAQYEWSARFWIPRDRDADKYRIVGYSNRALEYFSMLYFRDKGVVLYDLCGLTLDEENMELSNIDRRKLGFGGEIIQVYHFIYPLTWRGKIFCWLKKYLKKD